MKKLFPAFLLFIACGLSAQTTSTYTPPTLVPLFSATDMGNSAQLMLNVTNAVESRDTLILQHDAAMHAAGGYDQRLAALEAAIKLLQNPVQSGPSIIDLTVLPIGPLTGVVPAGGINWNTGEWNATAQGVQPAVLGQGTRNFVLPAGKVLANVTVICLNNPCQVKLTDTNNNALIAPAGGGSFPPGVTSAVPTNWTMPSGAVTVGTPISSAADLRIRSVTY